MNRILKFLPLAAALTCGSLAFAVPPVITNVTASQRAGTKLVDIYYDITDEDGDLMKVRVEISDNDGRTYSIPAFSLTGDIGDNIASGTGKHIVWDAGTDWDGEYSDLMRVKVFAIDAKGFPGMEWGNEVPPGGFLLGQDGGAEGSGPSRHVNIPWSYWLTKYEVTVQQYCDFLNAAIVTGHVALSGTASARSTVKTLQNTLIFPNRLLCSLGDDQQIRWNVNHFEVVDDKGNYPISVTWHGALAFCEYYGYDLPTHAEWEKAARGPDHDDQDEHLCYPWGNSITTACASYSTSSATSTVLRSVGYYDGNQTPIGNDMVNGYGLYDVIGNAAEWTRTCSLSLNAYPNEETLFGGIHTKYTSGGRLVKGVGSNSIFYRALYSVSTSVKSAGFRPIRRLSAGDISKALVCVLRENFDTWESKSRGDSKTVITSDGEWIVGSSFWVNKTDGVDGTGGIGTNSGSAYLTLPEVQGKVALIRCKVKCRDNNGWRYLSCCATTSSSYEVKCYTQKGDGGFYTFEIPVDFEAERYRLDVDYYLTIDDLEVWVYPEEETEE